MTDELPDASNGSESAPAKRSRIGAVFVTLFGLILVLALAAASFWLPGAVGEGFELNQWQRFLGRFHPVVLHLPIGMLALVFLLEIGNLFRREKRDTTTGPLFFTALSAIVAAGFGLLLYVSNPLDYPEERITSHLWWGVGFAALITAAFILKLWVRAWGGQRGWLYLLVLFSAGGTLGIASHDGGTITHGKTYLTDEAPNSVRGVYNRLVPEEERLAMLEEGGSGASEAEPVALEEQEVYADLVQPIFDQKCVACHGPDKQKGRLRMDSYEALLAGGKEGEAIEPGDAEFSNILFRVHLPLDDEEHMPPEGKRQMEPHEIDIVAWWIDSGALPDQKLAAAELPEAIQEAVSKVVPPEVLEARAQAALKAEAEAERKREELQQVVAELQQDFAGSLQFESQASPNLTFSAVNLREKFGDDDLLKLQPVMDSLVSLDLSSTSVTDGQLEVLGKAEKLRQLRLSKTRITSDGMLALGGLPQLESLNVYGTAVDAAGLDVLKTLPSLSRVYLWQTQVTEADVEALKEELPEVEFIFGAGF